VKSQVLQSHALEVAFQDAVSTASIASSSGNLPSEADELASVPSSDVLLELT
jgi:hypothetical protein